MDKHLRLQYYGSASVGEHGQIQVPAEARRAAGIGEGDEVLLLGTADGELVLVRAETAGELVGPTLSGIVELQRALRALDEVPEEPLNRLRAGS